MSLLKCLVFSWLLLCTPIILNVSAQTTCSHQEQLRLREVVANTKFHYELELYEWNYGFDIHISNFSDDIYVMFPDVSMQKRYADEKKLSTIPGFIPAQNYKVSFFASEQTSCPDFRILTKYIKTPHFNHYSNHPLCEGYENSPLCQKHSNIYLVIRDEGDFVSRMNSYIESLKDEDLEDDEKTEQSYDFVSNLLIFLSTYNLYIFVPIIFLGTGGIIYIQFKNRGDIL